MKLSHDRAEKLLQKFGEANILVIGDLMLDRYIFGSVTRISPEAPVPVVHVQSETSRPGGASNVALNIAALGGNSMVAGITGSDASGDELTSKLVTAGIDTSGVVRARELATIVKTRIIAERQQVARVDHEDRADLYAFKVTELLEKIPELVKKSTGVIIEDYGKGVISQQVVDAVLKAAQANHKPVGFDPKDNHQLDFKWLTLATPNYREACLATAQSEKILDVIPERSKELQKAGELLSERWGTDFLLITLGAHGMYLCPRGAAPSLQPTLAKEVFDVSGAGDTVIAVALTAISVGAQYEEAASLANHAAGIVVGKVGTATCSHEELLASF